MKIHLPTLGPDLPVHPFTGLAALGLRRNGAPIWPVRGGSDDAGSDDDSNGDQDDDTGDDQDGEGNPDDLGDAGKKALDAMKGQRNKARTALRPWAALAREFGAGTPEELRNLLKGKKPDGADAPDPEQIRREARAEAAAEIAKDRLLDKIEAKAAGRFTDPADAAALLLRENGADDFLDGSKVDAEAIAEALDELLERKPYLGTGKTSGERKTAPKPDKSQGSRGNNKLSASDRAAKRIERMGLAKSST